MSCGSVIEESAITSDVQFMEKGGGGHEMIGRLMLIICVGAIVYPTLSVAGQLVREGEAQPMSLRAVPGVSRTESKEVTFEKGRQLITQIASQLRINRSCQDHAFAQFKVCFSDTPCSGCCGQSVAI